MVQSSQLVNLRDLDKVGGNINDPLLTPIDDLGACYVQL